MILKTRYRDIPHGEIVDHFTGGSIPDVSDWEPRRAMPVSVITPPIPNRSPWFKCGQLFKIHDEEGYVCEHIAEIGD